MRRLQAVIFSTTAFGLILTMAVPAGAQGDQLTRQRLQQRTTTIKPPTPAKPALQQASAAGPVGIKTASSPNRRDHRAGSGNRPQGGVTVTTSKRKRDTSTCVKSVFGGPCVNSVQDVKDAAKRALGKNPRDHRN